MVEKCIILEGKIVSGWERVSETYIESADGEKKSLDDALCEVGSRRVRIVITALSDEFQEG